MTRYINPILIDIEGDLIVIYMPDGKKYISSISSMCPRCCMKPTEPVPTATKADEDK